MKRFLLALLILGFTSGLYANTSAADLFDVNTEAIEADFSNLYDLESFVSENQSTYSDLEQNLVLNQFNLENKLAATAMPMFGFDDIDWGSFAWGFCCWPIGFFVVILNSNKDSDQKLSYWIGIGVSWLFSAVGYVAR